MQTKDTNYQQIMKDNKCCVIIPTYNNASTIQQVIDDVALYCADIFVVNDGCTDNTVHLLSVNEKVQLIGYKENKGKGYALRYAFKMLLQKGFKYAISIDADGQHYASDLPKFIKKLEEQEEEALILGSRMLKNKGQAKASSFANKFANFWLKIETGISLSDSQSGYRLYPLEPIANRKWFSDKYEFELEVLVRSIWKGIPIEEIDIDVYYAPEGERVSHFRPFWDFFRISVLNTVLVTLALLYFRPLLLIRKYRKKGLKQTFKEELAKKENTNIMLAASLGFGLFMGVFPVWGYQLLLGFTIAHLLKLNKVIFFIAANISLPPLIPLILYLSVAIGAFLMGEEIMVFSLDFTWEVAKQNLYQYLLGAVSLSFILGLLGFGVFYVVLNRIRK